MVPGFLKICISFVTTEVELFPTCLLAQYVSSFVNCSGAFIYFFFSGVLDTLYIINLTNYSGVYHFHHTPDSVYIGLHLVTWKEVFWIKWTHMDFSM